MKRLLFGFLLSLILALPVFSRAAMQDVKQDMQQAGSSTKDAAKKTGHKIKRGTKKVAHKSAKATRKGARKVERKTQPENEPR